MKKVVTQREAQDNYHAQLIAQAMENAGADVFSVSQSQGCIAVYCTHSERISVDEIDAEIEKVLEKSGAFYQVG
jgi:hypothetical protein